MATQVTTAVLVARGNPGSKAASEHVALLRGAWAHRVALLRGTLTAITDHERFLGINRARVVSSRLGCRR